MNVKVSPYPVPELKEFLRPFRQHFYRAESLHTLERYATGLLADVERKSGAGIAEAVAGLSDSALSPRDESRIERRGGAHDQRCC